MLNQVAAGLFWGGLFKKPFALLFFEIKRWRNARDGRSNPRRINRLTVFSDIPNTSAVSRTLNAKRGRINISLASLETGAGLQFELAVGISSISAFMVVNPR
jgi:hypothetical protein